MKSLATILLFTLLGFFVSASAETERIGNLEVNYNVITTDSLIPVIAKAYGIERSPKRGLLTVAVTETSPGAAPRHINALIDATIVNQFAQIMNVRMRPISEGSAIYYLGDFGIAAPDYLRFSLQNGVTETGKPYKIEFQRNFPAL